MRDCYVVQYDMLEYRTALEIQQQIRNKKERDRNYPNFLMLLQHNNVFTIGKHGNVEHILVPEQTLRELGVDVVEIRRGGDVTYHGPGQLVAYFLLDLQTLNIGIKDFVWKMEETVIKILKRYNIQGKRIKEYPGVWVEHKGELKKIAAVGARASKHITTHGLALNVQPNMEFFDMIIACGIKDYLPVSMKEILKTTISMETVYEQFILDYAQVFDINIKKISSEEFIEMIK